jgi:outer membrane protein assembly factor BamB
MTIRQHLRLVLLLLALTLNASIAAAQTETSGIEVWRAQVEFRGEHEDFFIALDPRDGTGATISIPAAGIYDLPAGPYRSSANQVEIPGLAWTLRREGVQLIGDLPGSLVPHYRLTARFGLVAEKPKPRQPQTPTDRPPAPAWTYELDMPVWAGLVHDHRRGNLIAAGASGGLVALNASTGRLRWRRDLGSPVLATPTLHGELVLVVSDAAVHALVAASGEVVWKTALGPALSPRLPITDPKSDWDHYGASVAASNGLAVVAGRDGCVQALAMRDGKQRWRYCGMTLVTGTPAIARGRVLVGDFAGRVRALRLRDGKELWLHDEPGALPHGSLIAGNLAIVGTRAYDLVGLDLKDGTPKWRRYFWFSWIDSTPQWFGGKIYVGSSDALAVQAFDPRDGRRLWSSPVPGWAWPDVAVDNARVYAAVVGTRAYLAPRDGGLAAIDRKTGQLRWFLPSKVGDGVLSGYAASPVLGNGYLFAADLGGTIRAFPVREQDS